MLKRLDEITRSAIRTGHARAVLALGSIGLEMDRIDEYSDLDVWVIAEDGYKEGFIKNLDWIRATSPVVFQFKHSPGGYGLTFEDGIFAEVDTFEAADMASLNFPEARIVWKAEDVPDSIRLPQHAPKPSESSPGEWLGEALGNLYVGLGRYHRGEKLTAMRFIQVYAVDQLLKMAPLIETEQPVWRDIFGNERRFEWRFPDIAQELPDFLQGYERTPESAQSILEFFDRHFELNAAIKQAILGRIAPLPAEN